MDITKSASGLAALIGRAIIVIGVRAFVAPQRAGQFGIPDTPADTPAFRAWLSVKAVRDLACALFLFIRSSTGRPMLLHAHRFRRSANGPAGDGPAPAA